MALDSTHYIDLPAARRRAGVSDSDEDEDLERAGKSASRAIDIWCGQSFYKLQTATARHFRPRRWHIARVDPFWTTTDLVIVTDHDDDGTYETTWTAADYELDQFGGELAAMLDAPYDTIRAVGSTSFPTCNRRVRSLRVTAQWGWAAVPQPVTEACEILTLDLYKRKDAAFGIATGSVDFGGLRIGRDVMAQVATLLEALRRTDRAIGFGFA